MGPVQKSTCNKSIDLVGQASIKASTGHAGMEQEEGPQENGRRPKKRSNRCVGGSVSCIAPLQLSRTENASCAKDPGPALESACSNSTDLVRQASIEASTGPAGVEQEEAPQENGRQPRRPKKRSGRRKKERQPRSSFVAVKDQEANGPASNGPAPNDPVPTATFGEGFGMHDSTQAWAEGTARSPFVLCSNCKPISSRSNSHCRWPCTEGLCTQHSSWEWLSQQQ